MRAPVSGPALIGRESDLQVLGDALSDAQRGVARCVALGGDAGMGKTRLLAEFRATIDSSVVVLAAECVDLGPLGVPFGPVRTIFRQLVSVVGVDAVLAAAGAGLPAIVALLPELADRLDASDPGVEPIHEALTALLAEFSRDRTIALVIDDLQWADAATLSLIRFLLMMSTSDHLLLVLAYRTDDLDRSHPLRQTLVELDRARAITRLQLRRLDDREVGALITNLRGVEPEHDVVERIASRSEGVPFYVEELVSIATDQIPDTLRDVLLARYERLQPGARALLRALAVGGMEVDHDILRRVSDAPDLDDLVRSLSDDMMLVAVGDGYGFRHALVREAVYGELLPGERQRLHERYANVLEEVGAPASETSYHWFAAHDLSRALGASIVAFDEAVQGRAFASALQLGERVLEIWNKTPDAELRAQRSRAVLLGEVTDVASDAGDRKRALALVDEAIAAFPPEDIAARVGMLLLKATLRSDEGLPWSEAEYVEGLEILEDSDVDLTLKARLQLALATRRMLTGHLASARALREDAMDTAKKSGSKEMASRVLGQMGWAEIVTGDVDLGRRLLDESFALIGDGEDLLRYATNASDAFIQIGEYRDALRATDYPIQRARDLGLERSWGVVLSNSVDALIALGLWDEAEVRGQRVLAIQPSGCSIASEHRRRIFRASWRDNGPEAAAIVRDHGELIRSFAFRGDLQDLLPAAAVLGDYALFQGDLAEAWRQATLAWEPLHEGATGYDLPLLGLGARVIAEMRRLGVALPQHAERNLYTAFSRMAFWPIVPRWRALVDAELSGAEGTGTDVLAWQTAVEQLADESMPAHLRAYSWWRLGQAELNSGDRMSATTSLQTAIEDAEQIGATWVANRAHELVVTAGLGGRQRSSGDDLTARERQVLELVAEGLSNKEIADRLFISAKTASVHVSAILRKLGVATRTQAAMTLGQRERNVEGRT
jgi:DNA-binding CsgD family transcriptional regulator